MPLRRGAGGVEGKPEVLLRTALRKPGERTREPETWSVP
jgi:hypothetical protein